MLAMCSKKVVFETTVTVPGRNVILSLLPWFFFGKMKENPLKKARPSLNWTPLKSSAKKRTHKIQKQQKEQIQKVRRVGWSWHLKGSQWAIPVARSCHLIDQESKVLIVVTGSMGDLYTVVVLTLWKILLQSFHFMHQWCLKIPLLLAYQFYTSLMLGRGSKCLWQFVAPAVVVVLSPDPTELLRSLWQCFCHPVWVSCQTEVGPHIQRIPNSASHKGFSEVSEVFRVV